MTVKVDAATFQAELVASHRPPPPRVLFWPQPFRGSLHDAMDRERRSYPFRLDTDHQCGKQLTFRHGNVSDGSFPTELIMVLLPSALSRERALASNRFL